MEKILTNWKLMQDVHDLGETCGLYRDGFNDKSTAGQFSEWEEIDYLCYLQTYFSQKPYYGRDLRYFNSSPWWYKNEFEVTDINYGTEYLRFMGVDYYCKIWLNGILVGEHEGYGIPFEIMIKDAVIVGKNLLIVKVWSPWDTEVLPGLEERRVFHVVRTMFKGTYEHDDTLISRDVNPVGIYDEVYFVQKSNITFTLQPRVISSDMHGKVIIAYDFVCSSCQPVKTKVLLYQRDTGILCGEYESCTEVQMGENQKTFSFQAENISLWNIWDKGNPTLYEAKISISQGAEQTDCNIVTFGFRDIKLERNEKETTFYLNGKRIFLRGTCYFPEVYLSEMSYDRYLRDMQNAKMLGFNTVRVHVHTAKPEFYEVCDRLGLAVIQDSDFNWVHEDTPEFAVRCCRIFKSVIQHLQSHPSIIAWICMNEPDFTKSRHHVDGYPGPQLWETAAHTDPSRPAILASYLGDDANSGDTHNYLGSLEDETSLYTDIDAVPEKLNTEFGIDAPPCLPSLRRNKDIRKRIAAVEERIEDIQYYQYRLIKYYIEHYRIIKYAPCSGYLQFMLIDLCPQSYYGIYDWWAVPRKCSLACAESNKPVAAILKDEGSSLQLYVVNDYDYSLSAVTLSCFVTVENGTIVCQSEQVLDVAADSCSKGKSFSADGLDRKRKYKVYIEIKDKTGNILTKNSYDDFFYHPPRPQGHPRRMTHELGVRLFNA